MGGVVEQYLLTVVECLLRLDGNVLVKENFWFFRTGNILFCNLWEIDIFVMLLLLITWINCFQNTPKPMTSELKPLSLWKFWCFFFYSQHHIFKETSITFWYNTFLLPSHRFGQKAGNYDLVIAAARHYWNAIKPFIVEPIERELLREPMEAVLECIAAVAANEVGKEDEVRKGLWKETCF